MSSERPIRVMLVDDHQVVRQGFSVFIKAFKELELVGEAANGLDAVRRCSEVHPDVILMDMIMPEMNGVTAIQIIRQQYPQVQIIALTSFTDDRELMQRALEAGAVGYLFKDVSIEDLSKAIHSAYRGLPVLSPEATRMLIQSKTQPSPRDFKLSERELEVLALLAEGLSNTQIADRLTVSTSTIKFHVSSILGKLGAASRTEAVAIALQHKLVT